MFLIIVCICMGAAGLYGLAKYSPDDSFIRAGEWAQDKVDLIKDKLNQPEEDEKPASIDKDSRDQQE